MPKDSGKKRSAQKAGLSKGKESGAGGKKPFVKPEKDHTKDYEFGAPKKRDRKGQGKDDNKFGSVSFSKDDKKGDRKFDKKQKDHKGKKPSGSFEVVKQDTPKKPDSLSRR